ncbi:MAG: hypothetical protein HZA58_05300 [Acidimicrobiia bacterium]|nr:hypothetical protein [Acidimicrobiia bacterium]
MMIPVGVSAVAGGVVGYFVTDASCAPASCTTPAVLMAAVVALAAGIGVGVVVVLAIRSFAEWRLQSEAGPVVTIEARDEDPGPPSC